MIKICPKIMYVFNIIAIVGKCPCKKLRLESRAVILAANKEKRALEKSYDQKVQLTDD
ncbi:MAG: hypothetical protein NMK33_03820 [Candidatus Cardinium sp.]|uniref:hypothetical protein n=1 Tax=Cardinium endosymbiont of Dermatophagoides farinae TaxID=2597823 RepID=UPI00164346BD|nr:hypothetical protein [Cardinium endosymbiont of Dermatophagoides farinae]UWW96560.1 MAG: hypothetical protein NMK33_03820 [Candidatus Cardinium sp.]